MTCNPGNMKKIMFICHGNICRSPMAEFIFRDLVNKCGKGKDFVIVSRATSTEEIWNGIGNPVYPGAKRELAKHGISCEGKRARQLSRSEYCEYDYLICMDDNNVRNSLRLFGGDPDGKICKMMDFTSRPGNVSDPWYTDDFETAYNDIYEGCKCLLERLTSYN